jgi:hypothetical protein
VTYGRAAKASAGDKAKAVPERFRCPNCPYLETIWVLRKKIFPIFTTASGNATYGIVSTQLSESFNHSIKTTISK